MKKVQAENASQNVEILEILPISINGINASQNVEIPSPQNEKFEVKNMEILKKEYLEIQKELKKIQGHRVNLSSANSKAKKMVEYLENDIKKGVKKAWKIVLIDLEISQAYSFNLRKIPSVKAVFEKWSNLPSIEFLTKLETAKNTLNALNSSKVG
jgi:hypothetical protein